MNVINNDIRDQLENIDVSIEQYHMFLNEISELMRAIRHRRTHVANLMMN